MKHTILAVLGAVALLWSACGSDKQKETAQIQELKDSIIAVHDEVMPKMGALNQMAKQLQLRNDSLQVDTLANKEQMANNALLIEELKNASAAMMQWMRAYKHGAFDTLAFEAAKAYADEQLKAVNDVANAMNQAEGKAKEALN
ncbi:hypothetical protein QWY31_12380 [Cytophagales bacterium LB-30]|uniref:Viral A-type inclusion protein n=2 Tax=Shiella aurantiaca TaxID=3058365 RepID=A0ABT8F741_9BACT|nr:hypothetical protein [Shiella aurantiaca]